jgi:YebC/PmpR family DNA-binding regulatory protein
MPQAAAVSAIMKALPSTLGRTMLVHHQLTPSAICSSCSEFFSARNAKLSSCWLPSPSGGAAITQRLRFYRSTTSRRRGECGVGVESSPNSFSERKDYFRPIDVKCVQQQSGGGHGGFGWQPQQTGRENINLGGARRLWISTPLQMGRRSAKIATKKGAQDKKKAKLYGRIGKQIVAAVKGGGPNPVSNVALAALLQTAKDYNIPKDIIDRNIKKASDKNQQDFEELTYEVYGFGGVGIVLEVLTDNNNRAAANVRDVVKKSGGKMAEKGSVLYNFKRAGVIAVKSSAEATGDDIMLAAMDAGAEDVLEPSEDDEDDEDGAGEKYYKILTPVDEFWTVTQKLKEAGLPVDTDNSGLELFPTAMIKPDDEAEELNRVMMEKLLDLDDVDAVSSTQG